MLATTAMLMESPISRHSFGAEVLTCTRYYALVLATTCDYCHYRGYCTPRSTTIYYFLSLQVPRPDGLAHPVVAPFDGFRTRDGAP